MAVNLRDMTIRPLARALSRLLFRRVEVQGLDHIPKQGSILVIANHENNLIDPMLLFAFTDLRLRFLAKHTLFSHLLVRPLVNLVNAVPVYRPEDGGDPRRNDRTIDLCARTLLSADTICVFPEGACHNDPARRRLKTGAARIALRAASREPAWPVFVLPIGLYYTAKSRFRSSAAVVIGEPIRVRADDVPESLNQTMAGALSGVTLNAASWEHSRRALREAEILSGPRALAPGPLERRNRHADALASLTATDFPKREDDAVRIESWDNLPEGARGLARALVLSLPALAGIILGALPVALMLGLSGDRGRTPDEPATRRLLAALLFFVPLFAAESFLIGRIAGAWIGLATFLAAPFATYAALGCADAWRDVWRARGPSPR